MDYSAKKEEVRRLCFTVSREVLQKQTNIVNETIAKIKDFLNNNFSQPIGLKEAAEYVKRNPSYISRTIKKQTGKSFVQLLTEIRMEKARLFLEETDMSCQQIAEKVGYPNSKYFERIFKQNVGVSPRDYRMAKKYFFNKRRFCMRNIEEYLKQIDQVISDGPYTDSWESLCEHETPKWYQNSKFGIFIHWGLYSVPAFDNEWYARNLYKKNSNVNLFHKEKYGDVSEFGYKDFIPLFRAEKFSPDEWAELFYESGARFVMPVAEHHDGFQMYASDFSRWNSMQMGPRRDILGELKQSVEKKDMVFCVSSHRAEHWWFYNTAKSIPNADVHLPEYQDFYGPAHGITRDHQDLFDNPPDEEFMQDWLIRTCEIVDKYQPRIMFFDWWIQQYAFKPYLRKFAAYYYNQAAKWQKEVTIDAKFDAFVYGSATRDIERGQLAEISPVFWQNDTSVAKNSWGYTENNDYKEPQEIICDLIDVVSKNGALLLNVGPKADGTIPQKDRQILLEIGKWMKVNSEAIYDTRPWKVYGEGPTVVPEGSFTDTDREAFTSRDIRFTTKGNIIYAFVMKWPEYGKVFIHSLGKNSKYLKSTIRNVEILGQELAPYYNHDRSLEIQADIQADGNPVVLKIEIE